MAPKKKPPVLPFDFWKNNSTPDIPIRKLEDLPFCDGPLNAKICIVGEAPGSEENAHEKNLPFIGASGRKLRAWLTCLELDSWRDVYFTNVIKTYPPDDDEATWIKENPQAFHTFVRILAAELQKCGASVIVPTGNLALEVICGKRGITNWRGSILPATIPSIKGCKCIPMLHPAYTLRNWKSGFVPSMLDLTRIKEDSEFDDLRLPKREYVIRPSYDDTLTFLHDLKSKPQLPVSTDIEVLRNRIASIQFANDPKLSITVPFQYRDGRPYWPREQEINIWKAIVDLLEDPQTQLWGQNFIAYDIFMLWTHGFNPYKLHANMRSDTQSNMQCLQPQLQKGLDFQTSIFTREPYYKAEGKEWDTFLGENEFWIYGGKDVCVVAEIAPQQEEDIKKKGLWEYYQRYYMKLSGIQLAMSIRGLYVDAKKKEELHIEYSRDIVEAHAKLIQLVGRNVNVNSHAQMTKLLYVDMKCKKQWKRNAQGNYSLTADKNALNKLSTMYDSPAFPAILKERELRTLHSNNIKAPYDPDGRIRTSYGFTETHRWRSFACPHGAGTNLQNWNKKMRVMIKPSPGMMFLSIDGSQAEARVVAYKSRDERMIEIFTSGLDIHAETASLIFDKPVDQIDHDTERYPAKRIVHASNYDMGPERFAMSYNADVARFGLSVPMISKQTAKRLQERYHKVAPGIRGVYQKEIQEAIKKTKSLTNCWGWLITFHDRIGPELFREAYAWYAQSTIANWTNELLLRTAHMYTAVHQMHDGILYEINPSELDTAVKRIHTVAMSDALLLDIEGEQLQIPVEFEYGTSDWKNLDKYNLEKAT